MFVRRESVHGWMGHTLSQRIVYDDCLPGRECLNGMEGIRWNDSDRAGTCALGDPSDGYFQFSFQDFPDLFVGVVSLRNRGPSVKLLMPKCHAGGIEIAASPARQAFDAGASIHEHSHP